MSIRITSTFTDNIYNDDIYLANTVYFCWLSVIDLYVRNLYILHYFITIHIKAVANFICFDW